MIRKILILMLITMPLSGCAWLLTPGDWETEFSCTNNVTEGAGQCASVQTAYKDFIAKQDMDNQAVAPIPGLSDSSYRSSILQEQLKLLKNPVKPIRIPEKIQRVLLFGYAEGDELYSPQWGWYKLEDGRYLLGDYLTTGEQ